MTAAGWTFAEPDVIRLLGLPRRRVEQLRRLGLLAPPGGHGAYRFRDLVALRVARTLLDQGITVRRIRAAVAALRRLVPEAEAPLAEVRVIVRDGEVLVERDARLAEPSGQLVMTFSAEGLAEAARDSVRRGLVRPLTRPGGEADRWFDLASELDRDPEQWDRAVDAYQRVTRLAPDHAAAWNNIGLLQHRLGRHEDARRHYEVALAADPACAEAAYNLGALFDDLGRTAEAIEWYREAIRIQPDYADAHFNLASVLERQDDRPAAQPHWRRYLDLDPGSRWAEIARSYLPGADHA